MIALDAQQALIDFGQLIAGDGDDAARLHTDLDVTTGSAEATRCFSPAQLRRLVPLEDRQRKVRRSARRRGRGRHCRGSNEVAPIRFLPTHDVWLS